MKEYLLVSLLILLICIVPLESRNSGGIEIVKNPSKPLLGEINLDLTEDLSIKSDYDNPDLFFRMMGDAAVDMDGNIYILDPGSHRLLIFDAKGNHLKTIGAHGEGPEDFNVPSQVEIDKNGNIYVKDASRKVRIFNRKWKLTKTIKLERIYDSMSVGPFGNLVLSYSEYKDQEMDVTVKLVKTDGEGNTILTYPQEVTRVGSFIDGQTLVMFGNNDIDANVVHCISPSGKLYTAVNNVYKISVYDVNGTLKREIIKDEAPLRLTDEEKDRMIKEAAGWGALPKRRQKMIRRLLPDYKPFFLKLYADSVNNCDYLYVFRKPSLGETSSYEVDIFNDKGQYVYRTQCKWLPKLIYNNNFYVVIRDEEDDLILKRFKLNGLKNP